MRQHRLYRLVPLLLAAAVAACDRGPELPTSARTASGQAELAPLLAAAANGVPGRYIVVLHPSEQSSAAAVAREVTSAHGGRVHHTYTSALDGFAATLTPAAVDALRRNPQVKFVEEDAMTYPSQVTQPGATWGLDRVDQRDLPLNTTYTYTRNGTGVRVYVIDSGILTAHTQFGGRASVGTDFVGDGQNGQDCNGHGTHVSGTIGGSTYGVAKNAQLIAVRVFPCSGGTLTSTVIAAEDWVRLNHVKPAVANYSGGGGFSAAHNAAVQALVAAGVTFVTAAGNSNADACNVSPASTPEAITVGATASNDARSTFSNWGACVDLFAPGTSITSAIHTSTTAIGINSGTSMASPHVAGVAALYLQGSPTATPAVVGAQILASSTLSRLTDVGLGSPNRLLFSLLTAPPPGALIGLNPGLLNFTFVRTVTTAAAEMDAATGGPVRQTFTADGEGDAKTAPADFGAGDVATATSPVLTSSVILSNSGTSALNWVAASNRPWLSADPTSGLVNTGFAARMNATVNATGLPAGTHLGAVAITGAPSPASVNVNVSVVDALSLVVGTPRTGQAGAGGSQRFFVVTVPAGATTLTIGITGGTGDADLYVRYGDAPSLSQYDCRPFIGGNVETCQVANPLPGSYYVMLQGFSAYSGVTLAATSGGTPGAPLNLAATPISPTSIRLAWADGSANETGFTVSRRTQTAGVWGAWADVGSPAANAVSFVNAGLTTGGTYQYRLRSCNAAGCSAWVASGVVTIPTAAPAPPFGLTATAASETSAAVTWTDGSTNETSFTLTRALRNLDGTWGPYATVASRAADQTSFTSLGLLAGRAYRFQLNACNPAGCSAWATSNIVTLPAVPPAPPSITGTVLSINTIRVQWTDASATETAFTLSRAPVSGAGVVGAFADVATLAPNQVVYNDMGLAVGAYRYRIRACNLAGCSAWTTGITLTIPPVPGTPGSLGVLPLSASSIRVTWTDPGTVETSFQVYRALRNLDGTWGAFTSVATPAANTTIFNNTGLLAARAYRYMVRACNLSGCSAFATSAIVSTPAS